MPAPRCSRSAPGARDTAGRGATLPHHGPGSALVPWLLVPLLLAAAAASASAQLGGVLPGQTAAKAQAAVASAPDRADLERELAQARAQQSRLRELAESGASAMPSFEEQRNLVARWVTLLNAELQSSPPPEAAADSAALPPLGAPPHPITDVDALRDQYDEAMTRQRLLASSLAGAELRLAEGMEMRRKAEEAVRLRREQLSRARDAQSQERLRGEAEVARLQERIAALELARADATRQQLSAQRAAVADREQALSAVIERVRLQQRVDDALLEQVGSAAQTTLRQIVDERQRLQAQLDRREAEQAVAGSSAGARELAALRGQLAALVELEQIEAGRKEAWRLRRLALEAIGAVDQRAEARTVIGRAVEQLTLRVQSIGERLQQVRSTLRAQRVREEALAAVADGEPAGGVPPALARERRALLAMQREADALELVQERLQRLQRLLERSRDDLAFAEQRQPAPFVQRVAGALRDGAAAIWRYELFSVGESSQVDGRTITLQHGVTVGKAVGVVLLFVLGWLVASRLSRFFIQLLVRRLQLTPQLGRVLNRWMMALLLLGVLLVVLELAHIPLTAFAFLGGALAIGVGFGTQNIIKNLISGVIILFERKIRVGDVVTIDGVSGTVTSVDLRATTVRGFDGIEAIVPNSQLLENRVSNWSYGNPVVRRSVDVGLRYGSDARAGSEAVLECARADTAVLAEPPPEVLFADFGADAQVLRLQYWLRLDGARSGPTVDSELRHAIAVVFAARGLEIAFPQRDVHLDVRHPLDVRVQGAA